MAAFLYRLVPGHGRNGGFWASHCWSCSHCSTDSHLAGVPCAHGLGLVTDYYRRTTVIRSGIVFADQCAIGRPGAVGLVISAGLATPPGLDAALLGTQS